MYDPRISPALRTLADLTRDQPVDAGSVRSADSTPLAGCACLDRRSRC